MRAVLSALLVCTTMALIAQKEGRLFLSGRTSGTLKQNGAVRFLIPCAAGRFLETTLTIWQTGSAEATLFSPGGEVIYRVHPTGDLHEGYALPWIAQTDGVYELTIQGSGPQTIYEVEFSENRPGRQSDGAQIRLAQAMFGALERLRQSPDEASFTTAVEAANSYSTWCRAESAACATHGSYLAGSLYQRSGRPDLAIIQIQQAMAATSFKRSPNLLGLLAGAEQRLGNLSQALEAAKRATEDASLGDCRYVEIATRNIYCSVLAAAGRMAEARPQCRKALESAEAEEFSLGAANAKLQLAQIDAFDGSERQEQWATDAGAIFRRFGIVQSEAMSHLTAGSHRRRRNEVELALAEFELARKLAITAGDVWLEGAALTATGDVYTSVGDDRTAITHYEHSLELARRMRNGEGEVQVLLRLAGAISLQLPERSLQLVSQALVRSREMGNSGLTADTLTQMGTLLGDRQKWAEGAAQYEEALDIYRRNGRRVHQANVLGLIAGTLRARKQYDEAEHRYREALKLRIETGDEMGAAIVKSALGRMRREQGELEEAKTYLSEALAIVERRRGHIASPSLRVTVFADLRAFYEEYIDLLMEAKQTAEAFAWSERARARGLLDSAPRRVQDLAASIPSELIRQEQVLRAGIEEVASGPTNAPGGLGVRLAEYERLQSLIQEKSAPYRALTAPAPLSANEAAAWLPNDAALVEYKLGHRRSFVWVITRTGGISAEVLPEEPVLDKLTNALAEAQTAGDSESADARYWAAAKSVSEAILKPVWRHIAGKRRIYVVTEGSLNGVSFAGLPVPGSLKNAPLIETLEIVDLPSLSVAVAIERTQAVRVRPPDAVIAFGNPAFASNSDFDPLPSSAREVASVMRVFPRGQSRAYLGFEANLAVLAQENLTKYRYLHFATHALVHHTYPELSRLVLSNVDPDGGARLGELRLVDIYNLKISADLVVLSACKSAIGKNVPGEGMLGLARGFLYAGARNVIATLWNVQGNFPESMMETFYKSVTGPAKLSLPAALRQAQLAMWRQGRSPRRWAAFVLYAGGGSN